MEMGCTIVYLEMRYPRKLQFNADNQENDDQPVD